jgi:hypothetical protein
MPVMVVVLVLAQVVVQQVQLVQQELQATLAQLDQQALLVLRALKETQ